jgi:subtilisin family serine protease
MRSRLRLVTLLVTAAVALTLTSGQAQQGANVGSLALQDTAKLRRKGPRAIPNRYIVVLDQDAAGPAGDPAIATKLTEDVLAGFGRAADHLYSKAINGFSVELTEAEAVAISEDPRVAFVEEDSVMETQATQTNPPWGLDRIGQRNLPLNNTYSYTTTGAGVNVYVIDTGIRMTHTQFGGRASAAFDAFGGNSVDCNGHGTHVAGTIGGSTYGVAKSVRLFAVRVLSCSGSGSTSGVIAGVDWVTAHRINPAVANMSLGGGASSALDAAVRNSIVSGVTYAIAAGNSNTNAANSSPARVAEAITVGSSTRTDARSSFSNFGTVVDVYAPGSSILSAYFTSDTASATLSGTSMAAPHVAGVAARILQLSPTASPATVRNEIVNTATAGVPTGVPSGVARLLFRSSSQ